MKRFKNITELIKAFRQGDITAGRTSSICNNFSTDFKNQPKYYFIDNIYFENGKAVRFINRTLKIEIVLSDYGGSCYTHERKDSWNTIYVSDHAYIREYIRTHTQNDATFILAVRFCLTDSYINDFINIRNSIKYVRTNAYYLLCRYYELRKNYQNARKLLNKKCKKYNIANIDDRVNKEFAISNYKGWRRYWTYCTYNGNIAYADLSLKLSKDEIITLVRKTFCYNSVRLLHHTSKNMSYNHFMKYYNNLANLKRDIINLNNYIQSANLTGYQQWYGKQIEYIAKVIQKYGLSF